jgi:hypothetical protein
LLVGAAVVTALCAQVASAQVQDRPHFGFGCFHEHHGLHQCILTHPWCAQAPANFAASNSLPPAAIPLLASLMNGILDQSIHYGLKIGRPPDPQKIRELQRISDASGSTPGMTSQAYAPEKAYAAVFNTMPGGTTMGTDSSSRWSVWSQGFGGTTLLRSDPASGDPDTPLHSFQCSRV